MILRPGGRITPESARWRLPSPAEGWRGRIQRIAIGFAGESTYSGSFTGSGDEVTFFALGGSYVTITGYAEFDLVMDIPELDLHADDVLRGEVEELEFYVEETGEHTLTITDYFDEGGGSYELTFEAVSE